MPAPIKEIQDPDPQYNIVRAKCAGCGGNIYDGQRIYVMRDSYYDHGQLMHEDLAYIWCKHCAPDDSSEHTKFVTGVKEESSPTE